VRQLTRDCKKVFLLSLVLVFGLEAGQAAPLQPASPHDTASKNSASESLPAALATGRKSLEKFDFRAASFAYSQILKGDPENIEALLGLAEACMELKDNKRAYELVAIASDRKPDFYRCQALKARVLLGLGRRKEALSLAETALKQAPKNAQALSEVRGILGRAQYYCGIEPSLAFKTLESSLLPPPTRFHFRSLRTMALIKSNEKDWRQAIDLYKRASLVNDNDIDTYLTIGDLYKKLQDIKAAERAYLQCSNKFKHSDKAWVKLGDLYYECGRGKDETSQRKALNKGIAAYEQGKKAQPSSAEPWRQASAVYLENGRLDQSVKEGRVAVNLAPKDAFAHYVLGVALMEKDMLEEAEEHLQKAFLLSHDYRKYSYLRELVHVLILNRKTDQALKITEDALRTAPNNPYSQSARAWALMCLKRYDEGFIILRRLIASYPQERAFRVDYMGGLYSSKRYGECLKETRALLALEPQNRSAWLCLLDVARATGDKKLAEEATGKLSKLPLDANTLTEVGFDAINAGAANSSLPAFKRALELDPDSADLLLRSRDPDALPQNSKKKMMK